jgi:iron complex outermembrane receptor protein
MMFKRKLLLSSALVLLTAGAAQAQGVSSPSGEQAAQANNEAVQGQPGSGNVIGEIVVTAEKRAESLQDVPVAISAFTDETRDVVGIQSVQDLTNFTPGLSYTTNNDRASVRGIGRFTNNRSSEGGVAIYNDGFYTSSTTTAATSSLFVERTEVLRGPQGTLYGRNSIGGAINIISKRPTDEFMGEIRGQLGNYDRRVIEGAISGPITDNLRYRLAANYDEQEEGYFTNISGGPDEGGKGDQFYIQGQVEGSFFDDKLEFWFRADTSEWHNFGRGPGGRSTYTTAPYETFPLSISGLNFNPLFVAPGMTPGFNTTRPALSDNRSFDANRPNYITLESDTEVLHVTLHLDNVDVRYVGGHTYYDYRLQTDIDGTSRTSPIVITPTTVINANGTTAGASGALGGLSLRPGTTLSLNPDYVNQYKEEVWWFSNELNIISTHEGPLQYVIGAYQFREGSNYKATDASYPGQTQFTNPAFAFLGIGATGAQTRPTVANEDGSYARTFSQNVNESYAAFTQLDYTFNDQFKATAGIRYTYDRKRSDERARIICFLAPQCRAFYATPIAPGLSLGPVGIDFSSQVYNPLVNALNPIDESVVLRGGNNAANVVRGSLENGVVIEPTGEYSRLLENSWSGVTGTVGVDWTPDRDTLAYAKFTRGYKAGGFNAGSLLQSPTTDKETIDAYEVGAKKTFFNRLQANASAFYYSYKDIQIPIGVFDELLGQTRTVFENLPKSRIIGFELETIYSPIDPVQILFNYSYLDAEITEACCYLHGDDPLAQLPGAQPSLEIKNSAGVVTQRLQSLEGQKLPASTPHRFTVNGQYTFDLGFGDLIASASYIWRDETYSSIFNRPFELQPAFDQVDARLVFQDSDDRYTLIAFVKNAFDEDGYAGVGADRLQTIPGPLGTGTLFRNYSLTNPRTYGVEVQYRF